MSRLKRQLLPQCFLGLFIISTSPAPGQVAVSPLNGAHWIERGRELWQQGDIPGSIDALRKAVEMNPRDETAYLELAPRMIGAGRIVELIPILISAQRELPESTAILTRLRKGLILTGRHAEAVEAAREFLRLRRDADTYCDMGMAQMQLRQFPDAIDSFEKAVALDQSVVNAWMFLGFAYRMEMRPEDAIRAFERALALNPQAQMREVAWGAKTALLGQFVGRAAAADTINREIAAHPENTFAWCLRAMIEQQSGRHEEALTDLGQALKVAYQPTQQYAVQTLIGWNQINLARYPEALQSLLLAERLGPVEPVSQALLAIAYYHLSQNQKVFDAVYKALRSKSSGLGLLDTPPFISSVFLRLASSLIRLKLWEDAEKAARYCIELTPSQLEPRMVLHTVLEAQSKLSEADKLMSEAARLHPALSVELETLGDLSRKERDRAKALSYWDKALRQTSDETAKARLRAKIAEP